MDGEHAYWAALSGLTPATNFSLADHIVGAGEEMYPGFEYWEGLSSLGDGYSAADHKFDVINGA